MIVKHLLEALKEVRRWNDITACPLDRLHVEGRIFALTGLRIPYSVVFILELACKVTHNLL
ncbi:hypothetical protein D3C72_1209840 [compost metagenome]